MIRQSYQFDVITPCFCAGADHDKAEIRAASIRGQLRWWFRVLGGFKSLNHMSLRDQESMIFGSAAGDMGAAGLLTVRVFSKSGRALDASVSHAAPGMQSPEGYLLFPLRNNPRHRSALAAFQLDFIWRGNSRMDDDLRSLAVVFGNLGALGFRSRRAMGSLAVASTSMSLSQALGRFSEASTSVRIYCVGKASHPQSDCIPRLAEWLRGWRQHGRSEDLRPGNRDQRPPENSGFQYAKRDHDIGYGLPSVGTESAFRPALGLPIIQRAGGRSNAWEWAWNSQRRKGEGRFASPVILRPHRDSDGKWRALVIFVEAQKWPTGKQVYLNGTPRKVSLDLYEAMKADPSLTPFP